MMAQLFGTKSCSTVSRVHCLGTSTWGNATRARGAPACGLCLRTLGHQPLPVRSRPSSACLSLRKCHLSCDMVTTVSLRNLMPSHTSRDAKMPALWRAMVVHDLWGACPSCPARSKGGQQARTASHCTRVVSSIPPILFPKIGVINNVSYDRIWRTLPSGLGGSSPITPVSWLVPGHAPKEVEKQVTILIEIALSGLPHAVRLLSHTQFGLSFVMLTFHFL
jgi:hypothetical protein